MTTTTTRPARNGVDTPTLFATLDAVKANPELAKFQFRATNRWISGTRNRTAIRGFYGAGQEDTSRRRTVFLSGGAGLGKSFLAEWLRQKAARHGWRTGAGMASTVESAWPYAPVLDAVADLSRRHPTLLDGMDDRCRTDVERALSGRDLNWNGDGSHQRLYVAVAELIRLASAGTGLLLTIDDVHEADEASLRMLHYLARSFMAERTVLVLSHRRQPVTDTFEQVRSSLLARGATVDIALSPLTREQTADLVATQRPELDGDLLEQIWQLSGGLPFAVVEAARVAKADGLSGASPAAAVLNLLQPRVRTVLEHVAMTGSTFDTDEFVALSGASEDEAFDGLDAALAALGASPARAGHHLLAAGDARAAAPYVLRAADTEAAVGAYRDALVLVDSVRAAASGADLVRALTLRADLLAASADAGAAAAYREAMEASPPEHRRLLQARLARLVAFGGDLGTAEALLAELDLDGGPADPTIMLAQGTVAYFRGDLDAAREVSDRARRLVANSDTEWQVLDLVALQGLVAHNRGEWHQQLLTELRRTLNHPALATAVFDSHLCVAEYLLYGPTPYAEVIQLATGLRDTANRAGAMRAVTFATALIGEAALVADNLDLAERELPDAVDLHREIGAPAGEAHSLQRLAEVLLARGNRAGATRLLNRALPLARWSNLAMHLIQRVYGTMIAAAEEPHEARAIVDRARATVAGNDKCFFCEIMLAVPAAIACADVGDVGDAKLYLAAAERSAELWQGTAWQAAILEARAHLARAEGDQAHAARPLAQAAAIFEDAGQPRDAVRCRQ